MESPSIIPILKKISFFAPMCEEDLQKIVDNVTMGYFPVGHEIVQEGTPPDTLYILKRGKVQVSREKKEVATLSEGDFFGEMSLISNDPHNATVQCIEECELFTLTRDDFQRVLSENPEMASHISEKFMKRLRENIREEKNKLHE